MFLIHVSVRPVLLVRVDEIVFPLLLYGKTFWLVSFFLYYPNNKFFSIYNYLFRFYFSLFGFQWTFVQAFACWWRWWDSNPWPPACRAGALPTELHPHKVVVILHCNCLVTFRVKGLRVARRFVPGLSLAEGFRLPLFLLFVSSTKLSSSLLRLISLEESTRSLWSDF